MVAAEFCADRGDIIADGIGKITFLVTSAKTLQHRQQLFADRTFIKTGAALAADSLERGGKGRLGMARTERHRLAIRGEDGLSCLVQNIRLTGEIGRDTLGDGVAVTRISDRGCEDPVERHAAMVTVQLDPGIHRAGHGYRMRRMPFDAGHALFQHPFGIQRFRRASRPVESCDGVAAPRRIETEAVTADAGRLRFDNRLHGAGGKCRVHGVATILKDTDGRLGRQGVGSARHSIRSGNRRTAGALKITHVSKGLGVCGADHIAKLAGRKYPPDKRGRAALAHPRLSCLR